MTRHLPIWGSGEVDKHTLPADLGSEGQTRPGTNLTKGQILWLRGITRLQTQVCRASHSYMLNKNKTSSLVLVLSLKLTQI